MPISTRTNRENRPPTPKTGLEVARIKALDKKREKLANEGPFKRTVRTLVNKSGIQGRLAEVILGDTSNVPEGSTVVQGAPHFPRETNHPANQTVIAEGMRWSEGKSTTEETPEDNPTGTEALFSTEPVGGVEPDNHTHPGVAIIETTIEQKES